MLIVYDTKTGNVSRFIKKLNYDNVVKISNDLEVTEPFVLVTYTTGMGQIPSTTYDFLLKNHSYLKGVAASGNKVWGDNFAKSADIISHQYSVPLIHQFELAGMASDISYFLNQVQYIKQTS